MRSSDDLQCEFDVDRSNPEVVALLEEIQRLDARVDLLMEDKGMLKEYGVYSPKNKYHELYKVVGTEVFELAHAQTVADSYLSADGIHKDRQAAVVFRWITDWEYATGYPKSHNEIERMREERTDT